MPRLPSELGQELTDFESLKEAGAFAFTDDGVGIQSAEYDARSHAVKQQPK